jgi:hypothetical protein
MASTSFYNDNANRSYPFLRGEAFIPNSAIVDCGFVFGPGSGFTQGESTVYLSSVERNGDLLIFTFKTTAGNLLDRSLQFVRQVDDEQYQIEYVDTLDNLNQGSASESESVSHLCDFADDFMGYLVTGPLDDLLAALPGDGILTGEATVEPAQVQDSSQAYARSINIANADRTRFETPDECRDQCWPTPPQPMWIVKRCVQGAIRFREGYNLRITQDGDENTLQFDAQVGAGAGEPCEQVPLYPGEELPRDSMFYEGGPACNQVIRSINGIGGRLVNVKAGAGVRVSADPARNKIRINVDTHDLAICAPEEDLPSLSETSVSEDPCDCGPKE